MNLKKILSTIFILIASYSEAYSGMDDGCIWPKTYVEPSRLVCLPEGIFYESEQGVFERVNAVFCDDVGIYVMKYYQCPSCGKWNTQNICKNPGCTLYMHD